MGSITDLDNAIREAFEKGKGYPTILHVTDNFFYSIMREETRHMGSFIVSPPPHDTIMGIAYKRVRSEIIGGREFALDYQNDLKNAYVFGYAFRDGKLVNAVVRHVGSIEGV